MSVTLEPAPARETALAYSGPWSDLVSRLTDEADRRRRDLRLVEQWRAAAEAVAGGYGARDVVRLVAALGEDDADASGDGCPLSTAELRSLAGAVTDDDATALMAAPWTPAGHTLVVAWLEARADDPAGQARATQVLHGRTWPGLRKVMAALLIESQPDAPETPGRLRRSAVVPPPVQAVRDAAYDVATRDATAGVLFGLHARAALAISNGAVVTIRRSLDLTTSGRYKLGAAFRSDQLDDADAAELAIFLAGLEPLELACSLVETFERGTPDRDEMARRRHVLDVVTEGVSANPDATR